MRSLPSLAALIVAVLCTWSVPATNAEPAPDKPYDLAVIEGTPGGIAMAVRAAREGLSVLLVNRHAHLGGILSSGLGVWDTQFEGRRSPIYDEARQAIFDHYRTTYGENSPQYRHALPGTTGHTNGKFEPKVGEKILTDLVTRESRITVLKDHIVTGVERNGALLEAVTLRETGGTKTQRIRAKIFADCSYEGDLLALAKVSYIVGREGRAQYGEPHAGVVFMQSSKEPPTPEAGRREKLHDQLRLRKFPGFQILLLQASSGTGDRFVQAFNYRTILSSDPANRLPVEKPANYDPERMKQLEFGSIVSPLPNNKIGWNRPQLVGPHHDYPEADWPTRQRIMDAHWEATMGLLYFLQNDPSVPEVKRAYWQKYGLAKDEFADHGHRPHEFYVREARRLVGRYVFTQHDAMLAPGQLRAPVHGDSIGITEWYMDTHACTLQRQPESLDEGKMMLHHETFPGQVPYRALLPQGVDNLLVPVCLSATHVAWGTIRLEPTWMNLAESAAFAATQAIRQGQPPAAISTDELLRTLACRRVMITFCNDADLGGNAPWIPAVQYFGTRGFFPDYDARPDAPLKAKTAATWLAASRQPATDDRARQTIAEVAASEAMESRPLSREAWQAMIKNRPAPSESDGPAISRGEALQMLFEHQP